MRDAQHDDVCVPEEDHEAPRALPIPSGSEVDRHALHVLSAASAPATVPLRNGTLAPTSPGRASAAEPRAKGAKESGQRARSLKRSPSKVPAALPSRGAELRAVDQMPHERRHPVLF